MTYEELVKANETIRTTKIEKTNKKTGEVTSKDYAEVNQRIKAFRMLYPNGSISSKIISMNDGVVVMQAKVCDDAGRVLGTGTAYEKEGSTFINQTSYIENCETSAVGRALAMCGIGIDISIASYEEVANAMKNQEKEPKKEPSGYPSRAKMLEIAKKHYPEGSDTLKDLLKAFDNAESIDKLTDNQLKAVYAKYGGK